VDEIIVYNGGFNLKNPNVNEYNVPVPEISRDISELDIYGKILEYTGWTKADDHIHTDFELHTCNRTAKPGQQNWYSANGLATTLANQKACERGANWILRVDCDQILYEDGRRIKGDLADRDWMWCQYEFAGDIYHLRHPPPATVFNDSVFTHIAHKEDYYGGQGAPHIQSPRTFTYDLHCGHFRVANPLELSYEERLKHFRDRAFTHLYYMNYVDFSEAEHMWKLADDNAHNLLDRPDWRPADVLPPEVTLLKRKELREYCHAHPS
jgi:hypothetical protein